MRLASFIAVLLVAGCSDFATAELEFCLEHPGVCPVRDAGADAGTDGGSVTDAGARPSCTVAPVVSGFPQEGQTLRTSAPSCERAERYELAWLRCGEDGGCTAVRTQDAGWLVTSSDLGWRLQSMITGFDDAGAFDSRASTLTAPARRRARLSWLTGFEHATATGCQLLAGAARSGALGLRCNGATAVLPVPSVDAAVFRFAVRVGRLDGAVRAMDVNGAGLELTADGGALTARLRSGAAASTGSTPALLPNAWHVVQCAVSRTTGLKCRIDDGDELALATAPMADLLGLQLGTSAAGTPLLEYDDVAMSDVLGEHPLPDGETVALHVVAEGTHALPAAFVTSDGGGLDGTTWRLLDDWPARPDDFVAQLTQTPSAYAEYEVGDLLGPVSPTALRVWHVTQMLTVGAATTAVVQLASPSAQVSTTISLSDAGTQQLGGATFADDGDGRPWSKEQVDGMTLQFGRSAGGARPRLDAVLLEAELPR